MIGIALERLIYLVLSIFTMTFTPMHGTGVAVAIAIIACYPQIDVADADDSDAGEDEIDDDFLNSHERRSDEAADLVEQ